MTFTQYQTARHKVNYDKLITHANSKVNYEHDTKLLSAWRQSGRGYIFDCTGIDYYKLPIYTADGLEIFKAKGKTKVSWDHAYPRTDTTE